MRPFGDFQNMDPAFWAFVKYVSEAIGYTARGENAVRAYTAAEIGRLCRREDISVSADTAANAARYSQMRADILNGFAERMLMDAAQAKGEYQRLQELHSAGGFHCKIPMNKQKGPMREPAFFTAMIHILAEKTIREITGDRSSAGFDDDPYGLVYLWDSSRRIVGALSRRLDGSYPGLDNPKLVWEIKEYYYATTFGSRVADGVYETQLDGFELREIRNRTGRSVYHVLFVDAYRTWWIQGKSYLCRLVDAMNSGIVDEVIVGREIFTRWPQLLRSVILQ